MASDDINLQPTKLMKKNTMTQVYWNVMERTETKTFWQVTEDHSIIITLLYLPETILTSYFFQ